MDMLVESADGYEGYMEALDMVAVTQKVTGYWNLVMQ